MTSAWTDQEARPSLQDAEAQIAFLASIVDSSDDAIVAKSPEGAIRSWNRGAEVIYGYKAEEIVGKPVKVLIPHDLPDEMDAILRRIRNGERVEHYETRRVRKDGKIIFVSLTVSPMLDAAGKLVGISSIARDITERKRVEEEARDASQSASQDARKLAEARIVWLTLALDQSPACAIITDLDGTIRYVNRRFTEITGYSPEEAVGRSPSMLKSGQTPDETYEEMWRTITAGGTWRGDLLNRRKDGEEFWNAISISPIRDSSGAITHFVGVQEDISARRRSEQLLRENEARYRALFEKSPLPKWLYDVETLRFLEVNDAAVREYGYSREEFLRMTIKDIRPAEDIPALVRDVEGASGSTIFGTWRHRKKDRTIIDVEITSHTFPLNGRVKRVVVAQDITERRRAQRALEASEQRLALFFRLTRVGLMMTRLSDRKIIDANDCFLEQVGWKRDEVIGRTTLELGLYAHPEDVNRIYDGIRGPERIGSMEVIVRRKNGEEGNFLVTGASTELDGEACAIGAWHDITRLRHADAARQQSDERFRQIAESAREVFWLADGLEHKILYVSPAYETIWGRTCESLYRFPRDWVDAIHPEDRPRVLEAARTRQLAGTYDEEYRVLRPDGSVRWIRDRATPLAHGQGGVRVTGVAEDITDRRNLEDRLHQAQRLEAIGGLAGGVAHDFNNILSVILTYADMMIGHLEASDPMCADVKEIKNAGQRAADLTRQLLAFSRRQILQPRVIDLNEILGAMEKMLRRLIGEDIELTVVRSSSPARVNVDPGQMEQVIMNLGVNARDAMPEGGKLTLEIGDEVLGDADAFQHGARPGRYVMLAVSDTGAGMDAATQAHIFEPFFTTKEQGKGTGLGLSTVFGIVRQSGGSIWLYSEPGHGTTFKVYLPAVGVDVSPQEQSAESVVLRGSETVLLVEDEKAVRKVARAVLERNGYHVLEAQSGSDAVALCEQDARIDLLLTDVVMPRMSGAQLAARLKKARPELKVLYMSGYTDNAVVLHGVLHAEVAFLQKPFTPLALLSRVREALDCPLAAARAS